MSLTERTRQRARELGFDLVGVTRVESSEHAQAYRAWLERGLHGEMDYLARPDAVERRLAPAAVWPALRSAIVVAHGYGDGVAAGNSVAGGGVGGGGVGGNGVGGNGVGGTVVDGTAVVDRDAVPPGVGAAAPDPSRGVIARYARGRDYHKVVRKKLLALLEWLEAETGQRLEAARAYVDTGPVLERELAQRAGLGWHGRSTMLVNPNIGSYFFVGALLVELDLEPDAPFTADRCGTCSACVDACPTGALLGRDETGAPVMDATRCISYLTIEQRGPIPRELRAAIGNRIYGCDICQEVCPWNARKFVQLTAERDYRPDWRAAADRPNVPADLPSTESPSLVDLMRMTRSEWDVWTRGSAMRRAGYAGFRRNVAVALGNWLASVNEPPADAVAALTEALDDDEPLVREHALWALEQGASIAPVHTGGPSTSGAETGP